MNFPTKPHTYCHYCGNSHTSEAWPRTCGACGGVTYRNPVPVAVVLCRIDGGILTVRRANNPGAGQLALPGGFVDFGESWQQAASRELWEETGVVVNPEFIDFRRIYTAGNYNPLIFGMTPPLKLKVLENFKPNSEVSELVVLDKPESLAFPSHTEMVERYFMNRNGVG